MTEVWAAVPVKEFTGAKQRLAALLTPAQREILAATMLEDVLAALAGAHGWPASWSTRSIRAPRRWRTATAPAWSPTARATATPAR